MNNNLKKDQLIKILNTMKNQEIGWNQIGSTRFTMGVFFMKHEISISNDSLVVESGALQEIENHESCRIDRVWLKEEGILIVLRVTKGRRGWKFYIDSFQAGVSMPPQVEQKKKLSSLQNDVSVHLQSICLEMEQLIRLGFVELPSGLSLTNLFKELTVEKARLTDSDFFKYQDVIEIA